MVREIPLTKGYVALIDDDDFELVSAHKWSAIVHRNPSGSVYVYAHRTVVIDGRQVQLRLHRFLMDAKPGELVDHKDSDGLNNQRHNIRHCTRTQNNVNIVHPHKQSKCGFIGVHAYRRKWRARISVANRRVHLGLFETPEDAARAYDRKAIELHGEFARLNFERSAA
jgi:hypothetical protein